MTDLEHELRKKNIDTNVYMDGYVASEYLVHLRYRAHKLAPILWGMTYPPPPQTWEQAMQDPRLIDAMARCLACAEMCVRLIDMTTGGVETDVKP